MTQTTSPIGNSSYTSRNTPLNIEFIKANVADKAEIWQIFVPAMKGYVEQIWGWEDNWQTNEFNTRFNELNTSFVLINREKVGYIQYQLKADHTYLNMLILKPSKQGLGYGRDLLDSIQALQADKPLMLRCFNINSRALAFYKINGFKEVERDESFTLLKKQAKAFN